MYMKIRRKSSATRKSECINCPSSARRFPEENRETGFRLCVGSQPFDFFINGKKWATTSLDAGWTNYDKQVLLYVTFDVTRLLNKGMNVLGVMLGNGFYNVPNERYFKLTTSYGVPKMKMLLEIEYDDGTKAAGGFRHQLEGDC